MSALKYIAGTGFVFCVVVLAGASVMVLITHGRRRDLSTAAAVPVGVAWLAVIALLRILVPAAADRPVGMAATVLLVAVAIVRERTALVSALTNGRLLLPLLLLYGVCAFYVPVENQPTQMLPTTFARTFFQNPVKILGADDHLQYRTAQFVANRLDPDEVNFFYQYRLTDRGPLVGAAYAELVQFTAYDIPPKPLWGLPKAEQQWRVPDEYGYWLYRLLSILANASIVPTIGYLAIKHLGRRAFLFVTAMSLVLPFALFQVLMTYPKMLAASLLTLALATAIERKSLIISGGFAGLAYLAHPVALLYLPAIGLVVLVRRGRRALWRRALAWGIPVLLLTSFWIALGVRGTQGPSRLYLYPLGAYTESEDPEAVRAVASEQIARIKADPLRYILEVRLRSFGTSFLSFADDPRLTAGMIEPEDKLFFFSLWTLPGELGYGAVLFCYVGALLLLKRRPREFLPVFVLGPLGVLAYWGVDGRGLGPELLHFLWAMFLAAGAWLLTRMHPGWRIAVFAAAVVQTLVVAGLSFWAPTDFPGPGLGGAAPVLFGLAALGCITCAIVYLIGSIVFTGEHTPMTATLEPSPEPAPDPAPDPV